MSKDGRVGYVYLAIGGGYCKIGCSKNVDNRIAQISGRLPFEIDTVYYLQADDMLATEKALHSHFAHKRGKGEWFDLSPDDIDWFKSWDGNLSNLQSREWTMRTHSIEFVLGKIDNNKIGAVLMVVMGMVCLAASLFPVVEMIENGDIAFGPMAILLLALSAGVGVFKFVLIRASIMGEIA